MSEEENNAKLSEEEKPSQQEEIKVPSLEEQLRDMSDKYLRLLAEQENLRKRLGKDKTETVRFAIENTISEFLPIIDNFENALRFAESSSPEVKQWAAGFQMMLSQFRDVLHNNGIIAFHSEGNLFDPHYHEAMEIVETEEHPEGTILEEYAKGYKSGTRTLRPARVKVAKPPQKPLEEETNQQEEQQEEHNE